MKLFPKTFCYLLLLFALIILIMHLSIYIFLPRVYLDNMDREMDQEIDSLCGTAAAVDWADCLPIFQSYVSANGVNITVISEGEKLEYQGMPLSFEVFQSAGLGPGFRLEGVEGMEAVMFKQRHVACRDGREIHLIMSASTQPVHEAVRLTLFLLPFTSAAAVLASVIFAWLYSKKLSRPIGEMLRITRDMEALEKDAAVPVESGDELGMLAERINQLYRQLWRTIRSLELEKAHIAEMERAKVDFLRSASHELKTPLAGLRILLENMEYNVGKYKDHSVWLPEGVAMVDRLSAMIQDILAASRAQGEGGQAETLSVAAETEAVWKDYELLAKARGLSLDSRISPELTVEMDRTLFRRVWSNLLSNAVRYSDEGGCIRVRGGDEDLSVWNPCVPLSPEQSDRVFEAFYRPDYARSAADGGSGLGLYLVREILRANRLPCSFVPEGQGMRFTIGLKPQNGDI